MSREDIIAVATRLFAIYLLFALLRQIPAAVSLLMIEDDLRWTIPAGVLLVAGLAACALLWMFPLTVARKLLPAMREPRSEQSIDARLATTLGITLLGLWFLADALVDAVYWLTYYIQLGKLGMGSGEFRPEQWASIVTTVAEFVIAFVLLLGANGLRNLVERLRHGGRDYREG